MARGSRNSRTASRIFAFLALSFIFSEEVINGKTAAMALAEANKRTGRVKTIGVDNINFTYLLEDGDVIDCVDIYKQPSFDHPLLKDHIIQMYPYSLPKESKEENFQEFHESWVVDTGCPEGTIPILRTQEQNNTQAFPFNADRRKEGITSIEYAQAGLINGSFHGARGYLNVWNPKTADGDYSAAQLWVSSGDNFQSRNIIQAGWMTKAPDRKTRFVIGWTRDGYQKTGCLNLKCPGFMQTSRRVALGAVIYPLSIYQGKQYEIKIGIHRDNLTGSWWLQTGDEVIGYWPGNILTSLMKSARYIHWGGEVGTDAYLKKTTEMGSGHLPSEGLRKASYVRSMGYVNEYGFLRDPQELTLHVLNPAVYDALVPYPGMKYFGVYMLFGGPGHCLPRK